MRIPLVLSIWLALFAGTPAPAADIGCSLSARTDWSGFPEIGAGGLSPHFRAWLDANGYGSDRFARDDLPGGSYGGRVSEADPVENQPVVFVHGNSDRAAATLDGQPVGWTAVIRQFLARGYGPAELYATTWGPADPDLAGEQIHSFEYVRRIRAFILAVLDYTGAEKTDVIGHSMGVTLARKAIQGGALDGRDLGPPLTSRVDTFVGIAGANLGLATCFWAESEVPTCSDEDGFFPGYATFFGVTGEADFLDGLNADPGFEGDRVFSIWSRADQLVGFGGLVYGSYTSRIPGQDGEMVFGGYPYGHFCVRDLSAQVQLEMIRHHRVP
jgi:pimeloyl-ACP methyl ester carboxylesterase